MYIPRSDINVKNHKCEEIFTKDASSVKFLNTKNISDPFVKNSLQYHEKNIFKTKSLIDFKNKLINKKILLVVDNSGSMALPIKERSHLHDFKILSNDEVATRQNEAIFNILGAMQIFYNIPGCNPDIYLLNPVSNQDKILNIFNSESLTERTIIHQQLVDLMIFLKILAKMKFLMFIFYFLLMVSQGILMQKV